MTREANAYEHSLTYVGRNLDLGEIDKGLRGNARRCENLAIGSILIEQAREAPTDIASVQRRRLVKKPPRDPKEGEAQGGQAREVEMYGLGRNPEGLTAHEGYRGVPRVII